MAFAHVFCLCIQPSDSSFRGLTENRFLTKKATTKHDNLHNLFLDPFSRVNGNTIDLELKLPKSKIKRTISDINGIYLVQPWFFPLIRKSEHVMNTLRFVYLIEIIDNEQSEHVCPIMSSIWHI